MAKYSADDAAALEHTVGAWSSSAPNLTVPGAQGVWMAREVRWHAYMNRAGLTKLDRGWGEYMLNQEGSYIWNGLRGGEGNARDPLSFVMPLMFNRERDGLAQLRSVVQIILKSKRLSGPVAHRLPPSISSFLEVGYSIDPSDEEMYLLLTAAECKLTSNLPLLVIYGSILTDCL